jgi:hypothetical protein
VYPQAGVCVPPDRSCPFATCRDDAISRPVCAVFLFSIFDREKDTPLSRVSSLSIGGVFLLVSGGGVRPLPLFGRVSPTFLCRGARLPLSVARAIISFVAADERADRFVFMFGLLVDVLCGAMEPRVFC